MLNRPFSDLRLFGYDVIVADPPWDFRTYSDRGGSKSAKAHYKTMSFADIESVPVGHLARGDCLLLLWTCGWALPHAIETVKAWGFVFKSEMIWRKVFKSGAPRMGTGYRVRTMHEPIIVATIGNPEHKAFPSVFDGIAREHSRKPREFYDLVAGATPNAVRCDLFAREVHSGFDGWGAEYGKLASEAA